MKQKTQIALTVILIVAGLFILRIMNTRSVSQKPVASRGAAKVVVKVATVKKEDINLVLSYVGSLKAKDEINVYSKVTGKLAQYSINEGDQAKKGETIALVDRDETGLKYELARVESPIDGIIGRTLLDKGANILTSGGISGGTPVAIVVNMDDMIVRLDIPEMDIPYIKRGLKASLRVDAYPNEIFEGEISKVSEVVALDTRTLPIEITIPNKDHRLKSGMFSRIKIIAAKYNNILVISQDALVQEQGASYVFVLEDHTAKKKKVELGVREDSRIAVLDGIKENDRIITFGQQGLKDGAAVEIVQE